MRWSYHLERMPAWLEGQPAAEQAWWKANVYDRPELDVNATIQSYLAEYRQTAADLGVRADEGDAEILHLIYDLQQGLITWKQIAGSAGSAPTTSGEAPLLDMLEQQQQQAVAAYRTSVVASGGEPDSSDAAILATLETIGAPTFQIPPSADLELSAVYAAPPTPARDEAADFSAGSGAAPRATEFSGLSSFSGFGPSGSFVSPQASAPMATGAGMDRNTLLVLAVIAIGAFLLMSQRGS